jgi:hypothetical protein
LERQNIFEKSPDQFSGADLEFSRALQFKVLPKILLALDHIDVATWFPTLMNFDLVLLLGAKPDIHTAPTFEHLNIFQQVKEIF